MHNSLNLVILSTFRFPRSVVGLTIGVSLVFALFQILFSCQFPQELNFFLVYDVLFKHLRFIGFMM